MIHFKHSGNFNKTTSYLKKLVNDEWMSVLSKYGEKGIEVLSANTPVKSGTTAASWTYDVIQNEDGYSIEWHNTNVNQGYNIALLLQYGHGTRNGGYFVGVDYINPALAPIFKALADAAWEEVKSVT